MQLDLFAERSFGAPPVNVIRVPVSRRARVYAYHLAASLGWGWKPCVLEIPGRYFVWLMGTRLLREDFGRRGIWPAYWLYQDIVRLCRADHHHAATEAAQTE